MTAVGLSQALPGECTRLSNYASPPIAFTYPNSDWVRLYCWMTLAQFLEFCAYGFMPKYSWATEVVAMCWNVPCPVILLHDRIEPGTVGDLHRPFVFTRTTQDVTNLALREQWGMHKAAFRSTGTRAASACCTRGAATWVGLPTMGTHLAAHLSACNQRVRGLPPPDARVGLQHDAS